MKSLIVPLCGLLPVASSALAQGGFRSYPVDNPIVDLAADNLSLLTTWTQPDPSDPNAPATTYARLLHPSRSATRQGYFASRFPGLSADGNRIFGTRHDLFPTERFSAETFQHTPLLVTNYGVFPAINSASDDGLLAATAGTAITLWNPHLPAPTPPPVIIGSGARPVISNNGRYLAAASVPNAPPGTQAMLRFDLDAGTAAQRLASVGDNTAAWITDRGVIVGMGSSSSSSDCVLWDESGTLHRLPRPAGTIRLRATCISEDARIIVGQASTTHTNQFPLLWVDNILIADPLAWLTARGCPVPAGLTLRSLEVVSRDGLVLAGRARTADNLAVTCVFTVPRCDADLNLDGFIDFDDYNLFVACFESTACPALSPDAIADTNHDGFTDFFDYAAYVDAFQSGC